MANPLSAAFALVAYVYFFWSLPLAATGFMINLSHQFPELAPLQLLMPYNIDFNPKLHDDMQARLMANVALLGIFAIPHSIFARPAVKRMIGMESMYRSFCESRASHSTSSAAPPPPCICCSRTGSRSTTPLCGPQQTHARSSQGPSVLHCCSHHRH